MREAPVKLFKSVKEDDLVKIGKAVTPAKAVPPRAGWIAAPRFREDKLRRE